MNISISMNYGDICFYRIQNKCGLAKTDLINVSNSDGVIIEYIEYREADILIGNVSSSSFPNDKAFPGMNTPARTESFYYPSGNKAVYSGRLFFNEGYRVWGTTAQGEDNSNTLSACDNRLTYLVITNTVNAASSVSIGIQTISASATFINLLSTNLLTYLMLALLIS